MFHNIYKCRPEYVKKHGFPKPGVWDFIALIVIITGWVLLVAMIGTIIIQTKFLNAGAVNYGNQLKP